MIALVLAVGVLASLAEPTLQPPRAQSYLTGGSTSTLDELISTEQGGDGTVTIALTAPSDPTPVTYSGSFTVTGTSTNATAVSWYAHPAGVGGSCTGTSSWSCPVAVTPDAAGEGVEIVTITATGTGGTGAIVQKRIGFYVVGAHTAFDGQNADESRNATLADFDAVNTWQNIGSSAKDITKVSVAPVMRKSVAPTSVVSWDGSNHVMEATTAADWTFLHNGTDWTIEAIIAPDTIGTTQYLLNTTEGLGLCSVIDTGLCVRISTTGALVAAINTNGGTQTGCGATGTVFTASKYTRVRMILDDDNGAGADLLCYTDGVLRTSNNRVSPYDTANALALKVGASYPSNAEKFDGEIMRITIYQSALTATQQTINDEVDVWRLHQ